MSRSNIGGALDYSALAALHRPRDTDLLRIAVHELASRGLTERDIGAALNLHPTAVRRLLNITNSTARLT